MSPVLLEPVMLFRDPLGLGREDLPHPVHMVLGPPFRCCPGLPLPVEKGHWPQGISLPPAYWVGLRVNEGARLILGPKAGGGEQAAASCSSFLSVFWGQR